MIEYVFLVLRSAIRGTRALQVFENIAKEMTSMDQIGSVGVIFKKMGEWGH